MKMRLRVLISLGLLLLAAAWYFWPSAERSAPVAKKAVAPAAPAAVASAAPAATATSKAVASAVVTRSAASTNRESFRLANTAKTLGQLTLAPHAILLENALVDTTAKLDLNIPKHLRATGEPGAFIVQARGPVDAAFRAALAAAGGQIVSYIPNNAYLVQLSGAGAGVLTGNPLVQAVLPYEPYFKVQATLLDLAVNQKPLPPGKVLTLGLFADGADSTVAQIRKMGGQILGTDRSPFGPVVRVLPSPLENWLALAQLPGVQRVEPATHRQLANDLARVTMGIATDYYVTNANWLGLSGSNVLVEVNDSGIDAGHPDFSTTGFAGSPGANPPSRVTGEYVESIVDVDGHGTHVAGIIAGNGGESLTLSNAPSGSVTNADMRGKAPAARLHSFGFLGANDTNLFISDYLLQSIPALTNALISNNSWGNGGAFEYDLSAASYDAAVRDALPETTGPQPVLFVFAAGNAGGGDGNGSGGSSDTILSPGTAKNVITVGALEQFRNITNEVVLLDGTTNAVWANQTDSPDEVAFYSSRGNVGVQTEGTYGRFKPDVVAPGTFVVSTRPRAPMWDMAAYYNPTNYHDEFSLPGVIVTPTQPVFGGASVPNNAVGVIIKVQPNRNSPDPFPTNFPIYFSQFGVPSATNNDFATSNNVLSIPPGGGAFTTIDPLLNNGFSVAVGDPTNVAINFDLLIQIVTTNDAGNTLTVLSNLNETLAPYYYYDSGTSMAAPGVSGALALIQDFFTNRLQTTPSPALLKAMLINGARLTPGYNNFAITNNINYEGWGLVNVPNSIPATMTNTVPGATNSMFFLDQSPTNVLATGDSRTFTVTVPTQQARNQKLRLTLAWTDPPGNPAAGIKLVNNLDLVVTNNDSGAVYYGNNFIGASTPITVQADSNSVPDAINNVENIWLPEPLGTNYSVTVIGRNVTVNAVTAEQTNIVQDYALVISCGDALNPAGIQVAAASTTPAPVPSTAPVVTLVQSYTNGIYFNQIAGANAPWLSTNAIPLGTNYGIGTNGSFYIGQTNQWHFYIVTNTTSFTNAAFIIFLPATKATPRMGVFEDSTDNSTRPEADLNLLVASEPDANALQLTNLDQTVISNCLYTANGDQASLARGGTKFIAYNNSHLGQVYVIGVQCQDQMAGEYGFLPIFSENPFSSLNPDGSQTVNGLLLPAAIPDGNNRHAGVAYVFALALYPMEVGGVTVTNTISHENFGDLVGALTHGTDFAVLNNHSGVGGPVTNYTAVYNDDGLPGTMGTDGPGSLKDFRKSEAIGPWLLTEVDDSATASGTVNGLTLNIQPHKDLTHGLVTVTVPAGSWWYGYVKVPVGYTNLLVVATNLPPTSIPPLQMYLNETNEPDFSNYLARVELTNGVPPGNSISYGPPLKPDTYWVGLFNPDVISHDVLIGAFLAFDAAAISTVNYEGTGPVPLKDDAVNSDYTIVTNKDLIQGINIGLRVDHPRISDLVFTLISPDNTRYLLMENRGGQSTNGCGVTVVTTNIVNVTATGGSQASTNFINTGLTSGTFPITYNFYTVPDQMTVYYGTNVVPANLIFDTGFTNNPADPSLPPGPQNTLPTTVLVSFPPAGVPADSTYLTIVINQFGNTNGTAWTYTAGGVITNNYYLTFTEDTNLTTTPIKYAVPPFVPSTNSTAAVVTNVSTVWRSSFEGGTISSTLFAGTIFAEGWQVTSGTVDWLKTGDFGATPYDGNYYIDLNGNNPGSIVTNVPTVIGGSYTLTFAYAKNPDAGSTPSAQLSINGSPAAVVAPATLNTWSDLQWATTSVVFTATSTLTPIEFDSLTGGLSGVLLDAMDMRLTDVATNIITQSENIFYQPEQSIDNLLGTSAYGLWQLEILDNRAGATNNATLVSWQLQFTFANTNITSTISTNLGGTNYIAGGATQWFFIDVPTNADWATNTLLFASLPLQLWWSTNEPPTLTNTTDVQLLTNSTGGSSVLGTNTTPAFITPGGHYYLGVQNTNVAGAFYALNVFFHYLAVAPTVITLPATNIDLTSATLQARVHPGYTFATVYFEYGLDTNYGSFSTTFDITNNFNIAQVIGIGVTNLLSNTTYHFRAVATNSVGTNYGNDLTFFTTPVPYAQTLPATLVSGTNAQLNGFATPNASTLPTSAWFEWGTNATYGNLTPAVSVPNGFTVVYTNAAITNLLKNVAYHFRLVVSNSQAVTYGFDQVLDQANVVAWGANFLGQLNVPAGLSNVVAVAAAYDHSLALKTDGTAVGWGDNAFGQATVPSYVTNAVALAGGEYYSLAMKADGTVSAWGASILNQTNVPAGLSNVVYIAGGTYASLALKANGTISAWGANFFSLNVAPAGLSNVVSVAGGGYHNLALINNGTVTAWGDDSTGQTNVPAGLRNVVAIAAGSYHSLALKNDGTVVAWGDNSSGQTNVPAGLTNVVAIAAGGFHSLALRQDGSLVTWGDNSAGQTSVTVGLTNVVAISSGYFHNLALTPQSLSSLTNAFVFSLTNGVAVTNTIAAGATTYYQIEVPTNADLATNTLFYSLNGQLNVWFTTNSPPSLAAANFLFSGATNGVAVSTVLSTTSAPTNIVPGGTYYLGVQNTNNFAVNYAIGVDFHLVSTNPPPALTNTVPIASIIYTNIGGSNGFLLTWFAPSNDLFQVQWTDSLLPANWQTFTNIISYNTNYPASLTNATFNFFDDGSQTGGFGPMRFYRLILLTAATTNTLTLPAQSNLVAVAGSPVTVTNIATDSNTNAILSYSLLNAPAGATITNGIITWTNATPAGLAARFTTIVTDNNSPSLTASNMFTVFVSPFPTITNVVTTSTNTTLSWIAPTNDVFQVQWTTNLAPPSWTVFPGTITSTTGVFTFVDTNAPLLMKFYQLILQP